MIQPLEPDDPRSAGEFRLRGRVGAGGMGRVYLGYSPAGRAVAVKICHPEFAADPAFVRRFALEVAAARAVNGLYTAQVIAAGPDDRPPWLATSYVPGPSLYDAVTGDGPLPEPAVWRLAAGLAEALQAVHDRGLVHRDLKPTNVLLAADGPRVIDFGIARALDGTSLTTTGISFGTPSYMSPEQSTGDLVGPASDVFALGCVLCFAATGDVPFGDGAPPAVLYRVVSVAPELDAVPAGLRDLIAACLAKNPAGRPALPQILRACQAEGGTAGEPAGAPGYGPAPFWPAPVAALIARYQAGLRGEAAALASPGEPTRGSGERANRFGTWPPQATPPAGPAPAVTPRRTSPAGRRSPAVSRRRVVAGLAGAGVAAAGLATAGWAVSRSGRGQPPDPGHETGLDRLAWSYQTGGPVTSGAAFADGVLYIGSDDQHVHALEAATGRPVRMFGVGGAVSAAVTAAGGSVLAGSVDGTVHALRIAAGGPSWTHTTGGAVRSRPTVTGDVVYVGSDDRYVYALHAGTGQLSWRHPTGGAVRSVPLVGQSSFSEWVYVGSDDGYLYGLDTASGRRAWRFGTGGAVNSGPVQDMYASLYVGSDEGSVFGVYANTGKEVSVYAPGGPQTWRFPAGGAVRGTPVLAGDVVYAASAAGTVYAVAATTAEQLWSYRTGGPVSSGLALDGTMLYAGSDDRYVYAIDITTAEPQWRYRTGGPVRSQILVANGLVYFGSLDHRVYALHA